RPGVVRLGIRRRVAGGGRVRALAGAGGGLHLHLAALRGHGAGAVAAEALPVVRGRQHGVAYRRAVRRRAAVERGGRDGAGLRLRQRPDLFGADGDRADRFAGVVRAANGAGPVRHAPVHLQTLKWFGFDMTVNLPTVVVIGYNRPKSLGRLLRSLSKAHYPAGNVRLVISLDKSDTLEPLQVARD